MLVGLLSERCIVSFSRGMSFSRGFKNCVACPMRIKRRKSDEDKDFAMFRLVSKNAKKKTEYL